jgi:hypothetical protein
MAPYAPQKYGGRDYAPNLAGGVCERPSGRGQADVDHGDIPRSRWGRSASERASYINGRPSWDKLDPALTLMRRPP